ncbi:MAG TPA: glycosyltransferase, partial [Thermodesulfovibrionales bacterium]|nr:glycosyltransferase [Thermodesulfovibrionales bacterium]
MKVFAALVTYYGTGGSFFYLNHLMPQFERMNYRVLYYLPTNVEGELKDRSFCRNVLKDPSIPLPFFHLKMIKYPYHLLKYLYNAFMLRPDGDVRVVHLLFPFYLTDWITIARLKKMGKKVLLTVHEVVPHRPFMGGHIDKRLMKRMYESADLLIVHTELLKNKLAKSYAVDPIKIRVIHHGYFRHAKVSADINTLKAKYRIPMGKKVLLFFGAIRENKGLAVLLHAMQALKSGFFLLIAGEPAGLSERPAEHYEEIIEKAGLSDSVYWVKKYIMNEEAAEFFSIADAIILPYKKTFHAQSGVLNLAIGYEKPCVASDVGGMGETVKKYNLGVAVAPENPSELVLGVQQLFAREDPRYGFDR